MTHHSHGATQVEFHGKASEFFGIWIVNVLLSIVTFGIYSAWAKVRTNKYFYQNTVIDGRRFDYHATGQQILIGRVIVVIGFMIYSTLSIIPIMAILLPIAFLFVLPMLLVRSLRFNAQMTSWANVRFGFDGTAWNAFKVYLLWPFLTLFTLYLAYPVAARAIRAYSVGNHRLGQARFSFGAPLGPFFKAFFAAVLWVLGVGLVAGAVAMPFLDGLFNSSTGPEPESALALVAAFYVLFFVGFIPAGAIWQAFLRNTIFNNTVLDGRHRLESDVSPLRVVWIVMSNVVVTFASLGLMLPWARIRLARYYARHTRVYPAGSLDDFLSQQQEQQGALGDAFTDLQSVDIGLPV